MTNNFAEYSAAIAGLTKAVEMKLPFLSIQGDSKLVIKQLLQEYKVNNEALKLLNDRAMCLLRMMPSYKLIHIPREKNARADHLCNFAMNTKKSFVLGKGL